MISHGPRSGLRLPAAGGTETPKFTLCSQSCFADGETEKMTSVRVTATREQDPEGTRPSEPVGSSPPRRGPSALRPSPPPRFLRTPLPVSSEAPTPARPQPGQGGPSPAHLCSLLCVIMLPAPHLDPCSAASSSASSSTVSISLERSFQIIPSLNCSGIFNQRYFPPPQSFCCQHPRRPSVSSHTAGAASCWFPSDGKFAAGDASFNHRPTLRAAMAAPLLFATTSSLRASSSASIFNGTSEVASVVLCLLWTHHWPISALVFRKVVFSFSTQAHWIPQQEPGT
ncbi:hypothetical protein Cadr_000019698 [Camelus dromedarius]|uniref:Uncharacterized protein n=1 Tax=Camelus dromedarius TaxID=9838 RepID=A0A5N4D166_CAMDR|nr:hypothetical protein Cadr_000019698 [Camelus dromedarius]